jgi:Tfp pilus assembly protein PilE
MIELLVTLVLLGLVSSIVIPGIDSWLDSRERAAKRNHIVNKLALLPLSVNRRGERLTISRAQQLDLPANSIEFVQPIVVLANGFCVGGAFKNLSQPEIVYLVSSPFCEVEVMSEG